MNNESQEIQGPIRVLLVDDHRSILWGLRRLIEGGSPAMIVVDAVTDAQAALHVLEQHPVDVVLLDLDLGGRSGIDAIAGILSGSQARVLILTGIRDTAVHDRAVLAGACGVVSKEDGAETIVKAIEKAYRGEVWLDRAATGRIFMELSKKSNRRTASPTGAMESLTPRERQIMMEMVTDASATTRAIAKRLFISEHTLRNHLSSIYEKLGVSSRIELWAYANEQGIIPDSP